MKDGDGTKSTVKIVANIFISFLGSGVLGLPYAFKEVNKIYRNNSHSCRYMSGKL